ncbi:efflux transporter outer membrane subunit [Pseudomonas monteilii]|uniref:efflux transporter outer membrane subunit n=1 Tax=Pseudomonas monteilii TaxID=76759 RepID=UPI00383AF71C
MRPTISKSSGCLPAVFMLASLLLSGCSLEPAYERPASPVTFLRPGQEMPTEAPDTSSLFTDEEAQLLDSLDHSKQLRTLVAGALAHDRDYQIILLRVEEARAEYGIANAERLPAVQLSGEMVRQQFDNRSLNEVNGQRYATASIGISNYELDFFGRMRSMSKAARHRFLSTQLGQQAARKALITEVARQYLVLRSANDVVKKADLLLNYQQSLVEISKHQVNAGALSREDFKKTAQALDMAEQHAAEAVQRVKAARNALELMSGYRSPIRTVGELPSVWEPDQADAAWLVNLHSEKLLERYDVRAAEERLKAANASIGAARAAFFPSVQLSTGAGVASEHFHDLFSHSTGTWLFMPQVNIPIFDGGRNQSNLDLANIRKDIAVATYERTIQRAFKDMADAFFERDALMQRIRSQAALNELAQDQLATRQAQLSRGDVSKLDELNALIQAVETSQVLSETKLRIQFNMLNLYQILYGADATAVVS